MLCGSNFRPSQSVYRHLRKHYDQQQQLEFVVETCGAEKVLFASGGESLAFEKARVLLSVLSPEEQQKILLGNALSLFPELAGWLNSRKEVLP